MSNTQSMDTATLAASMEEPSEYPFLFADRGNLYQLADQNGGNYGSGQVLFDLATVVNSGRYIDWGKSYLSVPIIVQVAITGAATLGVAAGPAIDIGNNFIASLKGGVTDLLSSVNVVAANNTVVANIPYTGIKINYELLNTMSAQDEMRLGPTMMWNKNTSSSIRQDSVVGSTNNSIVDAAFSPANGFGSFSKNNGRLERMKQHCMHLSNDPTLLANFGAGVQQFDATQRSYVKEHTVNRVSLQVTAIIQMKSIHDYFMQLPMMKNTTYQIRFDFHVGQSSFNISNAATPVISAFTATFPNGYNPILLSPISQSAGSGFRVTAATGTVTSAIQIGTCNVGTGGVITHSQPQARLLLSLVTMLPQTESLYLAQKTKKVIFNEVWTTMINNASLGITSGNDSTTLLHNSLSCMRKLVLIPLTNASQNGSLNINPLLSPWSCEGNQSSAYAALRNLQVVVGGKQVFSIPETYTYENFLTEQYAGQLSLGGSSLLGVSRGLISMADFQSGYAMYVIDLSRISPETDQIPKSCEIRFSSACAKTLDVLSLLYYEKSVEYDLGTGLQVVA